MGRGARCFQRGKHPGPLPGPLTPQHQWTKEPGEVRAHGQDVSGITEPPLRFKQVTESMLLSERTLYSYLVCSGRWVGVSALAESEGTRTGLKREGAEGSAPGRPRCDTCLSAHRPIPHPTPRDHSHLFSDAETCTQLPRLRTSITSHSLKPGAPRARGPCAPSQLEAPPQGAGVGVCHSKRPRPAWGRMKRGPLHP